MNDFLSEHEKLIFLALGEIPEDMEMPYNRTDQEKHIIDLVRTDHDSHNLPALSKRFYKTFSGLFNFPGGDILYEI